MPQRAGKSSAGKPKKAQKRGTPKPQASSAQPGQPSREVARQDRYPTTWDEAEKWISSKCESHRGGTFTANISAFIARLDSLLRSGDMPSSITGALISPKKLEATESKPEPTTRISPRLKQPRSEEVKIEDVDPGQPIKRGRGRPRKSITPPDAQQLLTNYFQVPPAPASPVLNEDDFNSS